MKEAIHRDYAEVKTLLGTLDIADSSLDEVDLYIDYM